MPKTNQKVDKKYIASQFNARLPQLTHKQINELAREHGLTKTQVIILAVDRLQRELRAESAEASKEARMMKTVARIAPQFDLGQDEQSTSNR